MALNEAFSPVIIHWAVTCQAVFFSAALRRRKRILHPLVGNNVFGLHAKRADVIICLRRNPPVRSVGHHRTEQRVVGKKLLLSGGPVTGQRAAGVAGNAALLEDTLQ